MLYNIVGFYLHSRQNNFLIKRRILTKIILLFSLFCISHIAYNQVLSRKYVLNDVIDLACRQSPDALIARHSYLASYWEYRSHIASFRPSVSLDATLPELNRSISKITLQDGTDAFIERRLMTSSGNLSLRQNLGFSGGSLFLSTNLQRIDILGDSLTTSYLSNPVSIGINQPLLSFNSMRWQRKIEPILFQEARLNYVGTLENIRIKAVNYFFDLALAQLNVRIAGSNFSNADTLYKISHGRFNIGTISQNDLLQMELTWLNSQTELKQAELDLQIKENRLRSFLGFAESTHIDIDPNPDIPDVQINYSEALALAEKNNPQILQNKRQLIESERDVAKALSENRPNANLYASFGLTQSAIQLESAYKSPQNQQVVTVGLTVPIIDWGMGRGKVKMARSNQEVVETQVRQRINDFEQDVYVKVMQFNMQREQLRISAKADTVAQLRYDVTKQRFLIGKIDVLNLNDALREKDSNKRSYLSALRTWFTSYYEMRKLSLYDFEKGRELELPDEW
jgi:outer membrane protein TolC